jgi:hypothetical protein
MKLDINALINAIEAQQEKQVNATELWGTGELIPTTAFDRLMGMYAAFEVLTGMDYYDWKIQQAENA